MTHMYSRSYEFIRFFRHFLNAHLILIAVPGLFADFYAVVVVAAAFLLQWHSAVYNFCGFCKSCYSSGVLVVVAVVAIV